VAGIVYWDVDGDRQYASGKDLPLSGANVSLHLDAEVIGTETTDSTGTYHFGLLDPATYVLRAGPPAGFGLRVTEVLVPVQANSLSAVYFAADIAATWTPTATPTETSTPVTPSATPSPTVTATPTLRPTSTPTPTHTPDVFTIQGKVWEDVDADGARDASEPGLAGVRIEVLTGGNQDEPVRPNETVLVSCYSKPGGDFSLPDIPAGAYVVREINPAGYLSTTADEVIVPDLPGRTLFVVDFGDRPERIGTRLYLPLLVR
jgi:hypothetical protein